MTDQHDSKSTKLNHAIDRLLSEELLQLSLKDRNVIEEEIHGVSTLAPTETENPEFLEASLHQLSEELNKVSDGSPLKAAYVCSQAKAETYVNTPDFRLRFLRCELFDTKKAAIRMMNFLNFASQLFGPVALERPVRMTDLSKEEKKWMENLQMLPYRDQSGRPVLAWVGDFNLEKRDHAPRFRVSLYVFYCATDDIETQQKGCVFLTWNGSENLGMPNWEYFGYSKKLLEGSPVRLCSIHLCSLKSNSSHPIHYTRGLSFALGKIMSRVKFYHGNKVELMYKIKSYGIPVEWIPVTDTGNIKHTYLKQWMRGRNQIENESYLRTSEEVILCPGSKDVLLQHSVKVKRHPGNVMFENMIEAKLQDHRSASQNEKVAIIKSIISSVLREGRFLAWDNRGWWKELNYDSEANAQIHRWIKEKFKRLRCNLVVQQQISRSSTLVFRNQDNAKRRKISSEDSFGSGSSCGKACIS